MRGPIAHGWEFAKNRPSLFPDPCSLHPRSEPLPPNLPPQNRPRSIPTPSSPSSRPERSVVEGPPHFVVACFSCHPERSLARTLRQTQSKDPDELHPTTTLRPFLPQIPGSSVCHSAAPFFLSFRSAAEESAVVFFARHSGEEPGSPASLLAGVEARISVSALAVASASRRERRASALRIIATRQRRALALGLCRCPCPFPDPCSLFPVFLSSPSFRPKNLNLNNPNPFHPKNNQ